MSPKLSFFSVSHCLSLRPPINKFGCGRVVKTSAQAARSLWENIVMFTVSLVRASS